MKRSYNYVNPEDVTACKELIRTIIKRESKRRCTLVKIHTYETHFTYYGEVNYIYKFKDSNGNTIVWKTSNKGLEEDATYRIKGTIKEHSEYNGDNQTVLTRCKILQNV